MTLPVLIHVHIPKTAGTTLNFLISRALGQHIEFTRAVPEEIVHLAAMSKSERDAVDFVYGHFPHGLHRLFARPTLYFACFREPRHRILSVYRYVLSRQTHPLHDKVRKNSVDFSSFMRLAWSDVAVRQLVDNTQMRMTSGDVSLAENYSNQFFSAIANITADNFLVGDSDDIGSFLGQMSRLLTLTFDTPPRMNATEGSDPERELLCVDHDAQDYLAEFTKWDTMMYKVARKVARQHVPSTRRDPESVVDLLYRAVLRRAPDDSGRQEYSRLLRDGHPEVELVRRLCNSTEFASGTLKIGRY